MQVQRLANLDLLRACAILMVVVHHIFVQWHAAPPWIGKYTSVGRFGVDLFFVLSGWLIGGLYWRESRKFQHVEKLRFIIRRCFRTMPPYFAMLPIAWLGVFYTRHQPFDFSYLFFLQNYAPSMPFFLPSWSLCIEEQFYLLLPFLLPLVLLKCKSPHLRFLIIVLLPTLLRCLFGAPKNAEGFGYYSTATHFRFEGLALGVWAAYTCETDKPAWEKLRAVAKRLFMPMLASLIALPFLSNSIIYYVGFLWVALTFMVVLVALVEDEPSAFGRSPLIRIIALTSYSVYLTHSVVLNAWAIIIQKHPMMPILEVALAVAMIALASQVFFILFEYTAIKFRDRVIPRRA